MIQTCKRTSPDLGFVANCHIAMRISPTPSFPPATRCPPRQLPAPDPSLFPFPTVLFPHKIIFSPGRHLSPSQHTKVLRFLTQTPLPPLLPPPCHACRITNAVPLPPPKYLLTSHSTASDPPFSATTDQGASPLPRRPSPYCKPQVSASTLPTPSLFPDDYQCKTPMSVFPIILLHLPLTRLSRSRTSAAWPPFLSPFWGTPIGFGCKYF